MTEQRNPRLAYEMDRRMTTIEQQMISAFRRLDDHIQTTNSMLARLDDRQDKSDVAHARLIGGLIVAQFLAILFAPALRGLFGLNS